MIQLPLKRFHNIFIWLVFQSLVLQTESAKILIVPANVNSHILFFAHLGERLSKLGHRIEVLIPSNGNIPKHLENTNLRMTSYTVPGEMPIMNRKEISDAFVKIAVSKSLWAKFQLEMEMEEEVNVALELDCISLLDNEKIMKQIKDEGFQFAIMDAITPHCYNILPLSLEIPFATMSISWTAWLFRIPRLPSFSPFPGSVWSDEMTFGQRFSTFVQDIIFYLYYSTPSNLTEKYAPNVTLRSGNEFLLQSNLWLYLEDLAVGLPRPNMPNSISIGDIMAGQPEKPLPQDLEEFLQNTQGAILVSFGSYFDYVPEFITEGFCSVFQNLEYSVIWKLKNNSICKNAQNVKISSWLPQNDLLAHPKVRLFITHGGINSLIESVYHAKPVIVFPIAVDQPGNAAIAASKGYGIHMDISEFDSEELKMNIDKILNEPIYTENAKLYSNIMKHKQEKPEERVSFMIEHILKYGDKHLRTGAYKLSLFQFIMFDIFAFTLLLVLILLSFVGIFIYCSFKLGRICFRKSKKIKEA